jgi:hypothetical protein
VLRETLLLDGTIAENIRAGRPDATQDQLIAATAPDAHQFISPRCPTAMTPGSGNAAGCSLVGNANASPLPAP